MVTLEKNMWSSLYQISKSGNMRSFFLLLDLGSAFWFCDYYNRDYEFISYSPVFALLWKLRCGNHIFFQAEKIRNCWGLFC